MSNNCMDMEIDQISEIKVNEIKVNEIAEVTKINVKVVNNKRKKTIENVVKDLKRSWNILNKIEFENVDKFEKILIQKMCNENIAKLKKIKKSTTN